MRIRTDTRWRTVPRIGVSAVLTALATSALLVLSALPAAAVHEQVADPNDADGRFDVRFVDHAHKARPRRWFVTMYPKWTLRNTWDTGYMVLNLDTTGSPDLDYYVVVSSNGKRLLAQVHRDRARGRDPVIAKPRAWKKGRTIGLEVPWSKLNIGDQRLLYRWSVQTLWTGKGCLRTCFDFAPNGGEWVEQLYEEEDPKDPPRHSDAGPEPTTDPSEPSAPSESPEPSEPAPEPTEAGPSPTSPTPDPTSPASTGIASPDPSPG
ncbi:MAG: hypothetical protein WD739_01225 [Actinomycetota bacterium]